MTNEEAIAVLKEKYCGIGSNDLFVFRKAIEALEKQIPVSPEFTDDYYDIAICPRCRQYEFDDCTTTLQMAYCPYCGQAIEWKEIEPFGGEDDGNL